MDSYYKFGEMRAIVIREAAKNAVIRSNFCNLYAIIKPPMIMIGRRKMLPDAHQAVSAPKEARTSLGERRGIENVFLAEYENVF